ncbi:hypothetical protein QYE76_005160 [Lolium multiflorum]|uniref:Transposase (putative) gypsy type domain-containing protein n=1 Tax=Lolium multiflorum TaxID=4521 RepID=A0AAD8RSG7_LOLMU|nr:hypothetical protein QYE76_005160 [Lolium multiflorum]
MASADLGSAEWERSKISAQDINLLKKLGISKKPDALRLPSEESYPTPPMEYRVIFVDHLIRGLYAPIHNFPRGLLFVYGLQLHHLTPNSILHISIFITLCESFLGIQPNWALWKRIFFCRHNGSPNVAYNIGGVVICIRPDVEYFDVKFPDSVQGWRKKWLYIHEENHGSAEDNIPPFDGEDKIYRRRSWDAEATDEEKSATAALMTRIHELQSTRGKELSGIQITAYFLRIRVQPLQARKNPLWKYTGDNDVDRLSVDLPVKDLEKLVRKISSLSKKDPVPSSCRVKPYSATNALPKILFLFLPFLKVEKSKNEPLSLMTTRVLLALRVNPQSLAEANKRADVLARKLEQSESARKKAEADAASVEDLRKRLHEAETSLSEHITAQSAREEAITKRLESQNRKTSQEYELEDPDNDPLLDALAFLEFHGDEAREGIDGAREGLSQLYPYFFPKKKEPATFLALAKCFNPPEDLGLKLRQENMKIAVESTIALVANSQQNVDWTKVGDTQEMETTKWQSLIRAAKPNSKKILAYLGCKPTPAPSSSKPEV